MRFKNWKLLFVILVTVFLFSFIKFYIGFPNADLELVGIILTISSILFGLLAGFFISELWSRYTEIRGLQGMRSSEQFNLFRYAKYFFDNKKFESQFKTSLEKAVIADEVINWDEGHLEIPYFRNIESSFKHIKVKTKKDEQYFDNLLDSYNSLIQSIVRLDTLYKERLFVSEWLVVSMLSFIIAISVLFLDSSMFFSKIIIIIFPVIIVLALKIVFDLDRLVWGRELVTLEPSQRVFYMLGVKRFYLKKDLKFITSQLKDFRTEKNLKGELKKVYTDILKKRDMKHVS